VVDVAGATFASGFGQYRVTAALGNMARAFGQVTHGAALADQAGLSGTELGVVQPWHDGRPVSFAAPVLQPARACAEDVAAIVLKQLANARVRQAARNARGRPRRGRDGPGAPLTRRQGPGDPEVPA
jgi:hypothetical protein